MVFVWLYWKYQSKIRNTVVKIIVGPILLSSFGMAGFLALNQVGQYNEKYALENLAERAAITAYDIRYDSP